MEVLVWQITCIICTTTGVVWSQLMLDYDWSETTCPPERATIMKTEVAWGVPGRAYKTLPRGLTIAPSTLKGAGFGVLSSTFIPRFTWLGNYDGEIISLSHRGHISWYSWVIHRHGEKTVLLDGYRYHLSSFHRYINAPFRHKDANVIATECYGRIFHVTSRDVLPGNELLLYYGHQYARDLGIDLNDYFELGELYGELGLDLNNASHRAVIERSGYGLHQVKDLPMTFIKSFLKHL